MAVEAAVIEAPEGVRSLTRMAVLSTDVAVPNRLLMLANQPPADEHPAAVYLGRLAPGSRRTMRAALDLLAAMLTSGAADAKTLDWAAVRYQHAQAVRSGLAERYKPATVNKALSGLRGVLREAWRLGLITSEDYRRAADLEAVKGESLSPGRALSAGELKALLGACSADDTAAGARDAALLAVMYGAGLRRSEAVALDISDFTAATGMLVVRHGKGNRDRVVYATNGAADALADWLAVRGDEAGPLFLPVNKGGVVGGHRLTGQAVLYILRRRAVRSGVTRLTPHDLRRTFISDLLDLGADISTVQRLAGHAQVTTTTRYDRRGEATKRRASELLHVPYVRRGASEPTRSLPVEAAL
jgi:integrase/recombinase XerD